MKNSRGFSLLEILIIVAIMALLAGAGAPFYRGIVKNVQLESATKIFAADLRQMRSKSMSGEGNAKWGIRVVNVNEGNQYYELFWTATNYAGGTIVSTTTLSSGVMFSDPSTGTSKDIVFSKISGTTTEATVTFVGENLTQTISISPIGSIN